MKLVGLVALCLAVAACGKDVAERNAYVDEVNAVQSALITRFNALRDDMAAATTSAEAARMLAGYEDAVDDAAQALRRIQPPSEVVDLHRRFGEEIAKYRDAVRKSRAAVAEGDRSRVLAVKQELVTEVGRIAAALNRTIGAINRELRE